MSSPLLLNGNVDSRDHEIATLRQQLRQVDEALRMERIKNGQIESALRELRHLTLPFHKLLKAIHGELEVFELSDSPAGSGKWDAIKQRLAPRLREAVDIFLAQGPMKRTQLSSAMRMDYSNCNKNVIGVLLAQGLLVKNGQDLALKEL